MVRVAAWIVGLFTAGWAVCRAFPSPLVEPLVLIALGAIMVFVAGRGATATPHAEETAELDEQPHMHGLETAPAPAPVSRGLPR